MDIPDAFTAGKNQLSSRQYTCASIWPVAEWTVRKETESQVPGMYGYPLPLRSDWTKIRDKEGVKQGAVAGVNLGASFDAASTTFKLKTFPKHVVALGKLEKDVATYSAKLLVPAGPQGDGAKRLKQQMVTSLLPAIRKHESTVRQVATLLPQWDPSCKDLIKTLTDLQVQLAKGGVPVDQNKLQIPAKAERLRHLLETYGRFEVISEDKYSKQLIQLRDFPFVRGGLTHENVGKYLVFVKQMQTSIKAKIG